MSDWTPEVPARLRTIVYYAGLIVGFASLVTSRIVDDSVALLISNIGTATGSLAAALGVAYRPTKTQEDAP